MNSRDQDLHRDENVYENTKICTARRKLVINLDATELQTNKGHYYNASGDSENNVDAIALETREGEYEQIRCVTRQRDDRNIDEETRGKTIKWKDQPREIKIIIYALSFMVVMIYITVIIAAVLISLPKGEGTWTLWSAWSTCDVTCDNGTQARLRMCYNPSISTEELACEGSLTDLRECQKDPCPADRTWTHWTTWSTCDITCGDGLQTRIRQCTNSSKLNGEPDCSGDSIDTRNCYKNPCSDGTWSNWASWGSCSESCGGGVKSRRRTCSNPRSSIIWEGCDGSSEQVALCNKNTCDADGRWTLWSRWSNCDVTCDNGTQTRYRLCYNPSVTTEQIDCNGSSTESIKCQQNACIVDGSWTVWSEWSSCDVTCDNGTQTRLRLCYNPSVSTDQFTCEGSSTESINCHQSPCFGDGSWSLWSAWSNCDASCGNGTQTRMRMCYSPSVSTEQLNCEGSSTESIKCQQNPCLVGGSWTFWSDWSSCDVTCNNGTQTRLRLCYSPSVSTDQLTCEGSSTESINCQQSPCFGDGSWTLWSAWSKCDVTCSNGTQTRMRMCYSPSVSTEQLNCEGSSTESLKCQQNPCLVGSSWTLWSEWSNCDVTCDNGTQTRLRLCYSPSVSTDQLTCEESSTESINCQQSPCFRVGSWTLWSAWSSCDVTCNNGTQTRLRMCYGPSVSTEQLNCEGSSTESIKCQQNPCLDSAWSDWGSWGSCSESCGGGVKSRLRTCSNPRPSIPCKGCNGSSEQMVLCNKNTCDDHKVSFLAYGSTTVTYNTVLKFPTMLLNSGNGYNSSTGRFTCKISGIYNFAVTLTKRMGYSASITAYLRINGTNKLQMHTDPYGYRSSYDSYSLSVTGNFHLNTNDYVFVYAIPNYFYNSYSTSFTGVLVTPDN